VQYDIHIDIENNDITIFKSNGIKFSEFFSCDIFTYNEETQKEVIDYKSHGETRWIIENKKFQILSRNGKFDEVITYYVKDVLLNETLEMTKKQFQYFLLNLFKETLLDLQCRKSRIKPNIQLRRKLVKYFNNVRIFKMDITRNFINRGYSFTDFSLGDIAREFTAVALLYYPKIIKRISHDKVTFLIMENITKQNLYNDFRDDLSDGNED
jgi:hypothetical protein